MDVLFDKKLLAASLKASGFTDEQAQAQAFDVALRKSVATKGDMARLNGKMHQAMVRADIDLKHTKWLVLLVASLNVLVFLSIVLFGFVAQMV